LPQEEFSAPHRLIEAMTIVCPQCAAQMPADAPFCPGCGRRMIIPTASVATEAPLTDNFAAALAYVTFIPAVFFLCIPKFRQNRYVRFHSFQSIFLLLSGIVAAFVIRMLFSVLPLIPWFGYLLSWLVLLVFSLGWLILWIVVLVKALQGELFKLPFIGSLAERA
jgi:uncharacterized membrane protein